MRELVSSCLASTVSEEAFAGVVVVMLPSGTLLGMLPLSCSGTLSQSTASSLPCLYMVRTLRDSIISSVERTRRLVDLPRAEKREGERGSRCVLGGGVSVGCSCSLGGGGGVLGAGAD